MLVRDIRCPVKGTNCCTRVRGGVKGKGPTTTRGVYGVGVYGGFARRVGGYPYTTRLSILTYGFLVGHLWFVCCFYGDGRGVVNGTMRPGVLYN